MVLRGSSSMAGRGSEDAVGRRLVDVVDPVDWLVGGGSCVGGSEREIELQVNKRTANIPSNVNITSILYNMLHMHSRLPHPPSYKPLSYRIHHCTVCVL